MIFIVRGADVVPPPHARVVLVRATPGGPGHTDQFCVADSVPAGDDRIVRVHDGWYADDHGGGVAVWGGGRYWEVRTTPFDVRLTDQDAR